MILDAERSGEPFLVLRVGNGEMAIMPLAGSPFIVGRLASNDLIIDWDDQVSRVHAEILQRGSSWLVADDNLSTNGTFLGDQRISGRKLLEDGMVIRFGNTLAVFRDPGEEGSRGTTVVASDLEPPELTGAQLRVLRALCRPVLEKSSSAAIPATNREIADELFLSLDAVKGHLRVLFVKFGAADLPQNRKRSTLVDRAIRMGLAGR